MSKKLFALIAVLLMVSFGTAFAALSGDDVLPYPGVILSHGGSQVAPYRTFRVVRYQPTSGTANSEIVSPNSIVIWDSVSDDGITVTLTTTSTDSAVAGVLINATLTPDTLGQTVTADIGKRNWTFMQTSGLCRVNMFVSDINVAAGSAIGTSASQGQATGFGYATRTPANEGIAGIVLDTTTSATLGVECYLKGLN